VTLEPPKAPVDTSEDLPVAPEHGPNGAGEPAPPDDLPDQPAEKAGRIARTVAWSKATAAKATARAEHERKHHFSVDVGFRAAERQRRVAAMVLAGGIAYRVFFWTLALSVLASAVLGLVNPDAVQSALEAHGVSGWRAAAITDLSRSADGNTWWLFLVGGWLLLWTGYTCAKALVLTHGTIWGVPPPRFDRPVRVSLLWTGGTFGFIVAMSAARWVREQDVIGGFAATMLIVGVAFGFWLLVTHKLPNAAASWVELVPGAALVAVGVQAMHVFTVYFLGPKLEGATQLYGVVGLVTTALFWYYLLGRLIVAGATLNVEFSESRARKRQATEE
jgi:uncharacterized BrkB/YihY/UPF0761 family membrane protein